MGRQIHTMRIWACVRKFWFLDWEWPLLGGTSKHIPSGCHEWVPEWVVGARGLVTLLVHKQCRYTLEFHKPRKPRKLWWWILWDSMCASIMLRLYCLLLSILAEPDFPTHDPQFSLALPSWLKKIPLNLYAILERISASSGKTHSVIILCLYV